MKLEALKRDLDYINVYSRLKNNQISLKEKGSYFYALDDDWFMTNLMDKAEIMKILTELGLKEYGFPGVPVEQYDLFDDILWEEHCYLYYYEGAKPNPKENRLVRKLEVTDAVKMNEHYTYQSEDSLQYIEDVINRSIGFGIEVEGDLVSWIVQHLDGSLGIMYTLEEHRRKGYADILTAHLLKAVMENDDIPYIHIRTDNMTSMLLAEKNGFTKYKKVVWFGIKVD